MSDQPIVIPKAFARDHSTKRSLQVWAIATRRYHYCTKRVNWDTRNASKHEKARRREKWKRCATVLDTERMLIRWLAEETRHPDIWTDTRVKLDESGHPRKMRKRWARDGESRLRQLHRDYFETRHRAHHLAGSARRQVMQQIELIVAEIRAIQRMWIVELYKKAFPGESIPKPIKLHRTELFPRKIAEAKKWMNDEMAA